MILNFSLPNDFHIRCERHSDFLRFRRCATTWYASECLWGPIWPSWIKGFPQYLPAVTSVVLELMDTLRCHNFYLQVSVPKYGKGDWTLCPACSLTVVIGGHLFSVLGGREERVLAPLQRTDVGPNRSGAAPHPLTPVCACFPIIFFVWWVERMSRWAFILSAGLSDALLPQYPPAAQKKIQTLDSLWFLGLDLKARELALTF